jgi:squalene synthase HpnC
MDLAAELARFGPATTPAAVSPDEARAYCQRLALSHYENFTVATRLVPRHLRQHLCNVYAYCRWADDLADEPSAMTQSVMPTRLLDWWEEQLHDAYAGSATHPVFVALSETIREFDLPREPLADLLVAFRRDQVQTRYETMADLLTYCEKSANPVGRIVLCLGRAATAENVALADSICTGLQLANFWQDVSRDFSRGRIYIPQAECRRYGWEEGRFAAGKCDADFREMLAPLVAHADAMLVAGQPLTGRAGRDLALAVRLFLSGGRAVLAAIERSGYDVWSRRPVVGRLKKLRLALAALWQSTRWRE